MNTIKRRTRVAIYIRVSTKLQEDRYSLKAQTTELTKYAETQNWDIVDIFKDVDSGAKVDKVGLESLLDAVEEGLVDVVLVIEQDRLSRLNVADWQYLKDVLRENNVKLAEPGLMFDLSNENDEFISDLKNIMAAHRRRAMKRTMGRGIRQFTREGKVYGRQPDEYRINPETKKVEINEQWSWVISFIDRLYLEKGFGLHRIAQELNKLSRTPNGKKWATVQVKKKLSNKVYHGLLEKSFLNGETIIVEGVYPALRTKETYEKIQQRLHAASFKFPAPSYHHALRRVKLVCKHCGNTLTLIKGGSNQEGNLNVYVAHAREYAKPCTVNPSFNAELLTAPLFKALKEILLDRDLAMKYMDLESNDEEKLTQLDQEIEIMNKQIENNTKKLDRVLGLYLDGDWSKDKLDETKTSIEESNKHIKDKLNESIKKAELIRANQYNYESFIKVLEEAEEILAYIHQADTEMDDLEKEKLIGSVFVSGIYDSDTDTVRFTSKSIQNVPVYVDVKLDDANIVAEEKLRKRQYERYFNTQSILNEHKANPLSFMELKRITGLNAETLRKDEELFGKYRHLKPGKGSEEKKAAAVAIIKQCLSEDIKMRSVDIAKRAGINPSTVLKYIREYGLRPGRK